MLWNLNSIRHEWLVLDGEVLQKHPFSVWLQESATPPALIIGTTAHQSHSEELFNKHKPWTPELVRQHIQQSILGDLDLVDEVLKRYDATYKGLVQIISDIRTVCPLLVTARTVPNVPFYVATQTRGELEISNGDDDIKAIFGRYEPQTYEQRRYSQIIKLLFFRFVLFGEFQRTNPRKRVFLIDQDLLPRLPRYSRID